VTSSWFLIPHWTTMLGQPYIKCNIKIYTLYFVGKSWNVLLPQKQHVEVTLCFKGVGKGQEIHRVRCVSAADILVSLNSSRLKKNIWLFSQFGPKNRYFFCLLRVPRYLAAAFLSNLCTENTRPGYHVRWKLRCPVWRAVRQAVTLRGRAITAGMSYLFCPLY